MDGSHTGLLADQYVPPGNGQFTYWSPRGPVCTACIGAKEWFFGRDSGNLVTQVSAPRSQALHFALHCSLSRQSGKHLNFFVVLLLLH
ncbi:hypothetical protein B296_00017123 [Ensete ventricosum]|uniref:Uncharacterized protein n=1 Tax=Ensete ventricosum TaxID=4639 RepID=A0A426ZHS6_ENSVE|nr:hypothetical protein B296_00017123 [Ensete ventricosum]